MKQTIAFMREDVERVEAVIAETLRSQLPLMDEVGAYLSASRGKRLRPMLMMLSARAQGLETLEDTQIRVAAALEMVHMATLLHDDVIDGATRRRGQASTNARWGDDVAILMADYLFSVAFRMILDHAGRQALASLAEATSHMCEGEMFQIQKRDQWLSVEDYLNVIEAKTACLFASCSEVGALVGGGQASSVAALRTFGHAFGYAFQITDDLLDYVAEGARWGKSVGVDMLNGKQTLPLIHALNHAAPDDREHLRRCLRNGGLKNLDDTLARIRRAGGIERSQAMAGQYAARARAAVESLAPSKARDLLVELAEYVSRRDY